MKILSPLCGNGPLARNANQQFLNFWHVLERFSQHSEEPVREAVPGILCIDIRLTTTVCSNRHRLGSLGCATILSVHGVRTLITFSIFYAHTMESMLTSTWTLLSGQHSLPTQRNPLVSVYHASLKASSSQSSVINARCMRSPNVAGLACRHCDVVHNFWKRLWSLNLLFKSSLFMYIISSETCG